MNKIFTKQSALIIVAGAVWILGDYLTTNYEHSLWFIGEVVGLMGWWLFVVAIEK